MSAQDERFRGWMKEHLALLHRISRAFAEPPDQHDLLQELMIATWKAAPAFRAESSPATFIYRVAHNRALTWRAHEAGKRRRAAVAEAEAMQLIQLNGVDEVEAALLERLYAAIRKLSPLDRSLMLLALDGLSYREIAAIHGISETNVGARLSRARTLVSSLVEEEEDHGL